MVCNLRKMNRGGALNMKGVGQRCFELKRQGLRLVERLDMAAPGHLCWPTHGSRVRPSRHFEIKEESDPIVSNGIQWYPRIYPMMLSNDGIQWLSFSGSRFWLDLIGDFQSFRRVAAATMQCSSYGLGCSSHLPLLQISWRPTPFPASTCQAAARQACRSQNLWAAGFAGLRPRVCASAALQTPQLTSSDSGAPRLASCCLVRRLLRAQCSQTLRFFWAGLPKLLGQRCCHFQSPPGLWIGRAVEICRPFATFCRPRLSIHDREPCSPTSKVTRSA